MTTAFQSYITFINDCWTVLQKYDALSNPGNVVNDLYRTVYSAKDTVNVKTALSGTTLNAAMSTIFTSIGAHIVNVQNLGYINSTSTGGFATDYRNDKSSSLLTSISIDYLHVYPTGSTRGRSGVTPPVGRPASDDINWRLGLNVDAKDVETVLPAFMTLLDDASYKFIDHFKFGAPGSIGKADTFIIYMKKPSDLVYTNFVADAWSAISALVSPVPAFMPAWHQIKPGFAEASNPPSPYVSFGQYRCIVAYIAYRALLQTGGMKKTKMNFYLWLEDAMVRFGIPGDEPQQQEILGRPFFTQDVQDLFTDIWAKSMRYDPSDFSNLLKIG